MLTFTCLRIHNEYIYIKINTHRISAILLPLLPMTQPIKSLGTVIDIVSEFELEF